MSRLGWLGIGGIALGGLLFLATPAFASAVGPPATSSPSSSPTAIQLVVSPAVLSASQCDPPGGSGSSPGADGAGSALGTTTSGSSALAFTGTGALVPWFVLLAGVLLLVGSTGRRMFLRDSRGRSPSAVDAARSRGRRRLWRWMGWVSVLAALGIMAAPNLIGRTTAGLPPGSGGGSHIVLTDVILSGNKSQMVDADFSTPCDSGAVPGAALPEAPYEMAFPLLAFSVLGGAVWLRGRCGTSRAQKG
jgi:hypothetical protein